MSEHNQPNQQVGSQFNADAISIHHHGLPAEMPPSTREQIDRAVEQLQLFKNLFASAGREQMEHLFEEAEDLLIFIVGRRRLEEFQRAFGSIRGDEYHLAQHASVMSGSRRAEVRESIQKQIATLKRRISGIEYRGRGPGPAL